MKIKISCIYFNNDNDKCFCPERKKFLGIFRRHCIKYYESYCQYQTMLVFKKSNITPSPLPDRPNRVYELNRKIK